MCGYCYSRIVIRILHSILEFWNILKQANIIFSIPKKSSQELINMLDLEETLKTSQSEWSAMV